MNFIPNFDITYCPYSSFSKIYSCSRDIYKHLLWLLYCSCKTTVHYPGLTSFVSSCLFCLYPEGMTSFHYCFSSALIARFLEQTLPFCSVFLCSFLQHPAIGDQFWFLTCLSLVSLLDY